MNKCDDELTVEDEDDGPITYFGCGLEPGHEDEHMATGNDVNNDRPFTVKWTPT